jgi:hypothetical protein
VDGPVPAGSTTRVEMLFEIDDGIGRLLGPASGALIRFRGGRKDDKLRLFPKQIQSQNVEDINIGGGCYGPLGGSHFLKFYFQS